MLRLATAFTTDYSIPLAPGTLADAVASSPRPPYRRRRAARITPDRAEGCYGFRCESTDPRIHTTSYEGLDPYGGANIGPLAYNTRNGRIYSGQTRVAWELNPVELGDGGSLLFFTESLCHAGPLWTNAERRRTSIFSVYSPDTAQWHKTNLEPEVIAGMPPRRRTLFRGVWGRDHHSNRYNTYVGAGNTTQ